MLSWFNANPARYDLMAWATVAVVGFLAMRPLLRPAESSDEARSDWRWAFAIVAVLLAGRWPSFFSNWEFNPDEGGFIVGAATLQHDPVFWRSVDGLTAGPLHFYALIPINWLFGSESYLSARVLVFLATAVTLLAAHLAITRTFGRAAARLGGLPTLLFLGLTVEADFLSYASELLPNCLLALAFLFGFTRPAATSGDSRLSRLLAGLFLGAVPFAKLQATPIALILGLLLLAQDGFATARPTRERIRLILAATGGALLPALFFGAMVGLSGTAAEARAYFISDFGYLGENPFSLFDTIVLFWKETILHNRSILAVPWAVSVVILMIGALFLRRRGASEDRRFLIVVTVMLLSAIGAVLLPRRPYLHYLRLLVVPSVLLAGALAARLLATWKERDSKPPRRTVAAGALVASVLLLLVSHLGYSNFMVGHLTSWSKAPISQIGKILRLFTRPGETLGVWGWMNSYYVESGLRQATREPQSSHQIYPGPRRDYFRQRYLDDLRRSRPPAFADTEGLDNLAIADGLEENDRVFPQLAEFIRNDYTQVANVGGTRIFIRNDRLAADGAASEN